MKKDVFLVTFMVMFGMLTIGMSGMLREDIKWFSLAVFVVWIIQLISNNWQDIKTFLRDGMGYKF
jgi:hypothetical protein